jgi:hypothetical protein
MILVNVYTPKEVRIWYRMWPNREDLLPEPCDEFFSPEEVYDIGEPPEWMGDMDLDVVLSPSWPHEVKEGGSSFYYQWVYWALGQGLAPRQPFQLRIFEPKYSSYWTDCGYECDEDWAWEICDRIPLSDRIAADRWSRFMKHAQLSRARIVEQLRESREAQLQDMGSMYLKYDGYWTHGYYDEMCPPNGIRVLLMTRNEGKIKYQPWRGCNTCLGQGEDDNGKTEVALGKLLEVVSSNLPHIPPEAIKSLPVRW